ncbi:hypothetical protein Lal_00043454 [Lupinus albus]|nr:hypothetical protein Lal_00043454 [Lupinus albus]
MHGSSSQASGSATLGCSTPVGAMGRSWSNQSACFSCRLVPRESVLLRCRPGLTVQSWFVAGIPRNCRAFYCGTFCTEGCGAREPFMGIYAEHEGASVLGGLIWLTLQSLGIHAVPYSCVASGITCLIKIDILNFWFSTLLFEGQTSKVGGSKTIRYRPSLNHKRCDQGSADVAFRTPLARYEKSKSLGSGGEYGPDIVRIDRLRALLDSMGGGAWPFLVGGAICLIIAIVGLQRGIPSKRESSARVDYVLPFVHTARRSYRLNGPVKCSDCGDVGGSLPATL